MAQSKQMMDLERMLECPICLERMISPRILPCLHSFCEKCLAKHMTDKGNGGSFPCPICNISLAVPKNGVTDFRRNTFLDEISILFPCTDVVNCDICKALDSVAQAVSLCLQCRDHLCQDCSQSHCKTRHTANHRVVSLDEIRGGQHFDEIRRSQKVMCTLHSEEVLKIYCESCERPLCLLCKALHHDQHKMKNLTDAAKEADDVISGLLQPWGDALKHMDTIYEARQINLQNIEEQKQEFMETIHQIYSTCEKDLLEAVKTKKDLVQKQLESDAVAAIKQEKVACEEADLKRTTFRSAIQYAEKILESAGDCEKLQQFNEIKTRLEGLNVADIDTEVKKLVFNIPPLPQVAIPDATVEAKYKTERFPTNLPVQQSPSLKSLGSFVSEFNIRRTWEKSSEYSVADNDECVVILDRANGLLKVFEKIGFRLLVLLKQDPENENKWKSVACNNMDGIFLTDTSGNSVFTYSYKSFKGKPLTLPLEINSDTCITCDTDQVFMTIPYTLGEYLHEHKNAIQDFIHQPHREYKSKDGNEYYRSSQYTTKVVVTDLNFNIKHQFSTKPDLGLNSFSTSSICIDSDSNLVVFDEKTMCVYVVDFKESAIVRTYSVGLENTRGICADKLGHILVLGHCSQGELQVIVLNKNSSTPEIITCHDVTDPTNICIWAPGQIGILEKGGQLKIFQYLDM